MHFPDLARDHHGLTVVTLRVVEDIVDGGGAGRTGRSYLSASLRPRGCRRLCLLLGRDADGERNRQRKCCNESELHSNPS